MRLPRILSLLATGRSTFYIIPASGNIRLVLGPAPCAMMKVIATEEEFHMKPDRVTTMVASAVLILLLMFLGGISYGCWKGCAMCSFYLWYDDIISEQNRILSERMDQLETVVISYTARTSTATAVQTGDDTHVRRGIVSGGGRGDPWMYKVQSAQLQNQYRDIPGKPEIEYHGYRRSPGK